MAKKVLGVLGKVAKIATFGVLGSSILGGGKKKEAAPAVVDGPKTMPLTDSDAVARAKRVSMMRRAQAGGRTSTMLSDSSTSLGGGL